MTWPEPTRRPRFFTVSPDPDWLLLLLLLLVRIGNKSEQSHNKIEEQIGRDGRLISSKLVAIPKATTATNAVPTLNASPQRASVCGDGKDDDNNPTTTRQQPTMTTNDDK